MLIPDDEKKNVRFILSAVAMHAILSRRREIQIGDKRAPAPDSDPAETAKTAIAHADALIKEVGIA